MISLRQMLSPKGTVLGKRMKGGIKPPGFKKETLRSRIMPMPLPPQLRICLAQRDGSEAISVVKVGDIVKKYQLIANGASEQAVPVFAPTSGKISAISSYSVASAFAQSGTHIVLDVDGKDEPVSPNEPTNLDKATANELLDKIIHSGISGFGGADFPTHIKLKLAQRTGSCHLIINACECEPFISCDEALIREYAGEVVSGIHLLEKTVNAKHCTIAIESNKKEAISALQLALKNCDIELALIPPAYPAGNENQLIEAVTSQQIPRGLKAINKGVLVQNAGTVFAINKFLTTGQPCISRITTLAGTPLRTPKNFEALFGTPLDFLFELVGIDSSLHRGTLIGGSMMGITLFTDNVSITRATNSIVAKSDDLFPQVDAEQPCIRCGICADACPVQLLPQQLYGFSKSQNYDALEDESLKDCIECGACSYVCPSKIPLVQYFRGAKNELQNQASSREQSAYWQERFQYRQYRIKKQSEETSTRKSNAVKRRDSSTSQPFSRKNARDEIAAAVARVKQKKELGKHVK